MLARKVKRTNPRDIFPLGAVIDFGLYTKGVLANKNIQPVVKQFFGKTAELIKTKKKAEIKEQLKRIGFVLITAKEANVPKIRVSDGREAARQDFPTIHLRIKKVKESEFNTTFYLGEIVEYWNSIRTSAERIKEVLVNEGWKIIEEY